MYFHSSTIQSRGRLPPRRGGEKQPYSSSSSFTNRRESRLKQKTPNTLTKLRLVDERSLSIDGLFHFLSILFLTSRKYLFFEEFELYVEAPFFEEPADKQFSFFREVTSDRSILLKIKTDACAGTDYAVNYLEHVQAVISVNATRRGDLELFLTSPMGTRYVSR